MTGAATGLDPIENAVISTLREVGAHPGRPHRKTALVLDDVNERYKFAHRDIHARILALARPWLTSLRLLDFHGNAGDRSFEAAEPQYTEIRLAQLGMACADALTATGPALPIGLVMGDTYKGGRRPPLHPQRAVAALRMVDAGGDDAAVLDTIGTPSFPAGCSLDGDVEALNRGERARFRLDATVRPIGRHTIQISHLPPDSSEAEVCSRLHRLASDAPIANVEDRSVGRGTDIRVQVAGPSTAEDLLGSVLNVWGVHHLVDLEHPLPLAQLLRRWVQDDGHGLAGLHHLQGG